MSRTISLASALLSGFIALIGCSEVVPSKVHHAPTSPQSIALYQKPPRTYEILGIVEVSDPAVLNWGEHASLDRAIDALKDRAAEKGANGLLLEADVPYRATATGYYNEQPYTFPIDRFPPSKAFATAIWVKREE